MSNVYDCLWKVCDDVREPDPNRCFGCDNLASFWVNDTAVYRPHRRAVVQSIMHSLSVHDDFRVPREDLEARLGCPEARARVRHRRRRFFRFNALRRGQHVSESAGWWDVENLDLPESFLGTAVVENPYRQRRYELDRAIWRWIAGL